MTPHPTLRLYGEGDAFGRDGYPVAWHRMGLDDPLLDEADMVMPGGVKDAVRALAGHRCARCRHPYKPGPQNSARGEWSPCDDRCEHVAPVRWTTHPDPSVSGYVESLPPLPGRPAQTITVGRACALGYTVQAQWRILTVHHLNGVKADLRWWNLAALCQRCHLAIQGKVLMERVWPWQHSEWFKPYAAGWYAAAYLGEDLTRAETAERLDELLALERAPGLP